MVVKDPDFRRAWAKGSLPIAWDHPDQVVTLYGYNYRFRLWHTRRADGQPLLFALWPNHPSRHPFAGSGSAGSVWHAAIHQFTDRLV